ncbi:MAG: OprO/OprP family phosphate-selective porin [Sedimentisphaerales bacterium]
MKEKSFDVLVKSLLIATTLWLLMPSIVWAAQDTDARIKKFEAQLQALQTELAKLKPDLGPSDFRVFWKEGLRFESQDGNFKLKFGGRIQNDWMWISEDDDLKRDVVGGSALGDQQDGTEFRRARFYTSGLIYNNVEYKLQFDFAGGDADLKDAYLGLTDFPIGKLRFGHFKEPFSLEELTSSKYITFLERALPNVFAPGRNAGFMLHGTALAASDPRMTWAAGIFRDTDGYGEGQDDGGYNLTGRVTGLPWYEDNGASLLHVGVAYSHRNPNNETVSFATEPEAHLADDFVSTGSVGSDRINLVGLEAACVAGPFSLQGEFIHSNVDLTSSSADLDGYYVQASYFLTGEHRKYKTSTGTFDRVKPKENFLFGDGPGAWELAGRYSNVDLDDGTISGGELDNVALGLNWYLNPNMRIMWDYVHSSKDNVGNADMLLMRLQVDF